MHAHMPRFYMLLDQRRIERVPRPSHISPPHETVPAIIFNAHGWPGVRVRDILKDTVAIDSPNDLVFAQLGWRSTVVNLERPFKWPGYDPRTIGKPMLERINVRPDGRYMTRQEFAREICTLLFDFHRRISKYPIASGWEEWTLTTGSEAFACPTWSYSDSF
ncbi:hypothetical protein J3R83DRAFT_5721 [Lanmaoa asiatica]|nr:hypothetical protein J3R83DRAFT_5721 [Lanmaoa asiatica]